MRQLSLLLLLGSWFTAAQAQLPVLLQAYARTSAVTGREEEASRFVEQLFKAGTLRHDRLGNLVLVLGSGSPRRLLVAPLDEPGYVVSQIQNNGYLRVAPVGGGAVGTLYHQFLEGHDVRIGTANGPRNAISGVPSSHYDNLRATPERTLPPFGWQAAFLDVGAGAAAAVAQQGIQLLDPVTLEKRPLLVAQQWVAAPAMREKAAAVALATAAQALLAAPPAGTTVVAWTTLDLLNGKGFEAVANQYGPFNEVYRFDRNLEAEAPGTGQFLVDQEFTSLPGQNLAQPTRPARKPVLPNAQLANAHTYLLGLPARYAHTPVEAVAVADVQQLIRAWLVAAGAPATTAAAAPTAPALPPLALPNPTPGAQLLAGLVGQYGVSTAETPVREFIARQLPAWAKPTTDQAGNLTLTFGQGKKHLVFVAHMDEVGFVVDSIRADGRLVLSLKGGAFPWLWEAQPALLHRPGQAALPALFEPRPQYMAATKRLAAGPLTVFAGFATAQQARAAGIEPGRTTVTMPKALRPLGPTRAAARGLDDRVGCAALLLSLRHLDPAKLPGRVTYVWSTGEEIGLLGATFAAQSLRDADVVYPIDTFVSSDAPLESPAFGYCPLGQGAVLRVVESINFARRDLVQHVHALADRQRILVQEGMTVGGTDGLEFMELRHSVGAAVVARPLLALARRSARLPRPDQPGAPARRATYRGTGRQARAPYPSFPTLIARMNPLQAVFNIAEICAQHGITDVVLSPGSRSAPLTLAFARHPAYRGKLRVIPDERAAAFIGLGLAQATRRPVVLVCTSGTAGLNYAPAVAEAFFQQIPLLILTADRPPEWIDQLDGQTIRQRNLYGAHAKGEFEFPADASHADAKWHAERLTNEAINLTQSGPAGPVQVNIPLREPFYPKAGEALEYEQGVKIIRDDRSNAVLPPAEILDLRQQLRAARRVLVVAGQHADTASLTAALYEFAEARRVPVVADTIANVGDVPAVRRQDIFLAGLSKAQQADLRPDLLITFGQSLISKALKLFLRDAAPAQHWHLQAAGEVADTFRSLTRIIRVPPAVFFQQLVVSETKDYHGSEGSNPASANASVAQKVSEGSNPSLAANVDQGSSACISWQQADAAAAQVLGNFFAPGNQPFNEFSAMRHALAALPDGAALHLANSMAVRYANILGLPEGRQIDVFANRGTSGIDGCTSTAVGAALAQPERPVVLLTGDVAFFYDRNAFWHNYPTPNLRVVLFNNHGGGIFRLIDGPRQQPELDEFFETHQALTAENLCRDFGLRYFPVASFAELNAALPVFFAAESGAAVLEVFTDSKTNAAFFEEYRAAVKAAFA